MQKVILMVFAGVLCGTARAANPETVLTTYRVRPGKEADFIQVHSRAWQAIRRADLAWSTPHLLLRGMDATGKPYFTEVLSWRSHEAPDHVPDNVREAWNQLESLCEPRDGHRGIEFPEVTIVDEPESASAAPR